MRLEDKERVVEEVISRVLQSKIQDAFQHKISLESVIQDTIYYERRRLETHVNSQTLQELQYWKKTLHRLLNASEEEQKKILKEIITSFAEEIVGYFNPKVYDLVTTTVPVALNIFFNLFFPKLWMRSFPKFPKFSDLIVIQGETKLLQALDKIGTIILVPTHSSHMDSVAVGWTLNKLGLPPYTYGAGLNLFTNSLTSYFMRNLGAYKVDRKKTASLYKDVLKEYATVSLEGGYDNLFFPGGTRSRSGAVETRLKLGLLGTGIHAYIHNLQQKKELPHIFVVPCTVSFPLVLEASTLIEDFLKEEGKAQYIIEDDEFSKPLRILNYVTSLLQRQSRVYVTIAHALDVLGNRVDAQGIPYDRRGRPLDISRYMIVNGNIEPDPQRDGEYTKELGLEIQKAFHKHNVAMSTHLLAFVVHRLLLKYNPEMDIYRLLRTGGKTDNFPIQEVAEALERTVTQVRKLVLQGEIKLDERLQSATNDYILEEGLQHFNIYHLKPVILRKGDRIYPHDTNLIYYYHNRLQGYGLEKCI